MKSIKFSESELEFLQNHYELELLDAENYVGEIKNILKKLGTIEKEITIEKPAKNTGKKRGRPAKKQKVEAEAAPTASVKATKAVKPAKVAKPGKVAKKTVKAVAAPVEEKKAE